MICEDRIEQAKQAVIREREYAWKYNWALKRQNVLEKFEVVLSRAPDPPKDLAPATWYVRIWDTGCFVMDAEEYSKIPLTKRRKFEKLTKMKG
ncbi:MAG: hypothetical protein ACYCWE_09740 [Eubacteriales bacterium]